MKTFGQAAQAALQRHWADMKKARGFLRTPSEVSAIIIDETAQESADNFHVYTNVVPLFPFRNGGLPHHGGISNAGGVELKTGLRALDEFDGQVANPASVALGQGIADQPSPHVLADICSGQCAADCSGSLAAQVRSGCKRGPGKAALMGRDSAGPFKRSARHYTAVETFNAPKRVLTEIAAPNHGNADALWGERTNGPEPCADIIGG